MNMYRNLRRGTAVVLAAATTGLCVAGCDGSSGKNAALFSSRILAREDVASTVCQKFTSAEYLHSNN